MMERRSFASMQDKFSVVVQFGKISHGVYPESVTKGSR